MRPGPTSELPRRPRTVSLPTIVLALVAVQALVIGVAVALVGS